MTSVIWFSRNLRESPVTFDLFVAVASIGNDEIRMTKVETMTSPKSEKRLSEGLAVAAALCRRGFAVNKAPPPDPLAPTAPAATALDAIRLAPRNSISAKAASEHRTYPWWRERRGCRGRICSGRIFVGDGSPELLQDGSRRL